MASKAAARPVLSADVLVFRHQDVDIDNQGVIDSFIQEAGFHPYQAALGGGGKGMRVVREAGDVKEAMQR